MYCLAPPPPLPDRRYAQAWRKAEDEAAITKLFTDEYKTGLRMMDQLSSKAPSSYP